MTWHEALRTRWFKQQMAITLVVMFVVMNVIIRVMDHMEGVPGMAVNDPILPHLPVIDLTWPLTILIYFNIIMLLWSNRNFPKELLLAFQAYSLMIFCRTITLYSFPLEPPVDIIPLADPVVMAKSELGLIHTKDLFFSGHTATAFLCFLTAVDKRMRLLFLISTLLIGLFVLLQHVHYTVDVLAAPFVSYLCWKVVNVVNEKLTQPAQLPSGTAAGEAD